MNAMQVLSAILLGLCFVSTLNAQLVMPGVDPWFEVLACKDSGGTTYEWSLWVDQDRDGRYDHRMYRTCDGVLRVWTEGETVWDQVINSLIMVEVGNAPPTLQKEMSKMGMIWYVEEQDAASGLILCRSALNNGRLKTDCHHRPDGPTCYLLDTTDPAHK